ncbi:MAG: hypothetical protein ACK56F_15415, partial [bacterium]
LCGTAARQISTASCDQARNRGQHPPLHAQPIRTRDQSNRLLLRPQGTSERHSEGHLGGRQLGPGQHHVVEEDRRSSPP